MSLARASCHPVLGPGPSSAGLCHARKIRWWLHMGGMSGDMGDTCECVVMAGKWCLHMGDASARAVFAHRLYLNTDGS